MAKFVLIHGGFFGGWCWKKVKAILENKQHTVYTPTLTGLGERAHLNNPEINVDTHSADIQNFFFFEDLNDVILVGHSYAGLILSALAAQMPNKIRHVIYLDALIPNTNESLLNLVDEATAVFFTNQAIQHGNGWLIPPIQIVEPAFSESDLAWCQARVTGQTLASFSQKVVFDENASNRITKTFIHCSKNPHPTLLAMKERAQKKGWNSYEIISGHFPMIEQPEQLSDLLIKLGTHGQR